MPWTSILTALVLSAATATLVIDHEWAIWQASLLVGGVAAALILVLTAILLWLSPSSERAMVWPEMKKELRKELSAMLNSLRGK